MRILPNLRSVLSSIDKNLKSFNFDEISHATSSAAFFPRPYIRGCFVTWAHAIVCVTRRRRKASLSLEAWLWSRTSLTLCFRDLLATHTCRMRPLNYTFINGKGTNDQGKVALWCQFHQPLIDWCRRLGNTCWHSDAKKGLLRFKSLPRKILCSHSFCCARVIIGNPLSLRVLLEIKCLLNGNVGINLSRWICASEAKNRAF